MSSAAIFVWRFKGLNIFTGSKVFTFKSRPLFGIVVFSRDHSGSEKLFLFERNGEKHRRVIIHLKWQFLYLVMNVI